MPAPTGERKVGRVKASFHLKERITKVKVSVDLSVAKIFLSVFPAEMSKQVLKEIVSTGPRIRHEIAIRSKKQLRRVPEFFFKLDDSLDYIENIERSLKGLDNPLKPKS